MESNNEVWTSPVITCLETLRAELRKGSSCDVDIIKSLTSRLLYLVSGHTDKDKARKELASKANNGLPLLITIIEQTEEFRVLQNVILILKEILSVKSDREARLKILYSHNAVPLLLQCFVCFSQSEVSEEFLIAFLVVLARLGTRDRKYAPKFRFSGALKVLFSYVKYFKNRPKVLLPILQLMKLVVSNSVNATLFAKERILNQLLNSLNKPEHKATMLLTSTLETIAACTCSKKNINLLLDIDGVPILIQLLRPGHFPGFKRHNPRLLKIYRNLLQVLLHIAFISKGRQALQNVHIVPLLYTWCHSLPLEEKKAAFLVLTCSLIIQRCLPPLLLPIDSLYLRSFSLHGKDNAHNEETNSSVVESSSDSCSDGDSSEDESSDDDVMEGCTSNAQHKFPVNRDLFFQELSQSPAFQKFVPKISDQSQDITSVDNDENINSKSMDVEDKMVLLNVFNEESNEEEGVIKASDLIDDSCLKDVCDIDPIEKLEFSLEITKEEEKEIMKSSLASSEIQSMLNTSKEMKRSENFLKNLNFSEVYKEKAQSTKSVVPFVKIAYPDLMGAVRIGGLEPYGKSNIPKLISTKVLLHMEQHIYGHVEKREFLYGCDLFPLTEQKFPLSNVDEIRVCQPQDSSSLQFESRFESGNLRVAYKIAEREYDLILSPDINTSFHHQWFYFEVSAMESKVPYIFNIINCEKSGSLFNEGMCPIIYSVKDSLLGKPGWMRAGSNVCYFRNHYVRATSTSEILRGKPYYTLTFTLTFPHSQDYCYVAYHYPFTYSLLKAHIYQWQHCHDTGAVHFNHQQLCTTLGGNDVPLLTITAHPLNESRPYVFLSARVHPGESNSSWVMKGTIDFLLSDKPSAQRLRETFVFKIVPMLNPDGVINGCHRCSLTGEDLNRQWINPNPHWYPTIYNTKALLDYLKWHGKKPVLFCDYHGHSRRNNIFLYGCNPQQSWRTSDHAMPNPRVYEALPLILHHAAPAFSLENCCFDVEKSRESTARVTVWRQFGISLSYTMECSYGGFDQGMYTDYHIGITQMEEMGVKFCQALNKMIVALSEKGEYYLQAPPATTSIPQLTLERAKEHSASPTSTASSDDCDHEESFDLD